MLSDDYYYVDKTPLALRLIEQGKYYFLSRPRRFGKSLLLDTLAELFEGNRRLFQGLYADEHWHWQRKSPVIRISFGGGVLHSRADLDRRILDLLKINREALSLSCGDPSDVISCFAELIRSAHAASGERVVVLVDEYDKPMLDNLTRPEVAKEMRDGLRNTNPNKFSYQCRPTARAKGSDVIGLQSKSIPSLAAGINNVVIVFEASVCPI